MTPRKAWFAGLVGAALVSPTALMAQDLPSAIPAPAAGAGAGLGGAAGAGLGGAATAAAPKTLLGFLGLSPASCAACKAHICASPIGQLINNGLGPVGVLTGGLIPQLCPTTPTPAQIAALGALSGPEGAQAVAAKIKADEAAAAARVAAVEYLGTVDCRHWKEAKVALLNALRTDPNECVRFAAARALNSGCCCAKDTIEKLKIVVTGDDGDGFPSELSPRVKGAAWGALQNCLAKVPPDPIKEPEPVKEKEVLPEGAKPVTPEGAAPAPAAANAANVTHLAAAHLVTTPAALSFEAKIDRKPMAQVVEEARQALFLTSQNPPKLRMLPTGKRSVFHALAKARQEVPAAPNPNPNPNMNPAPAPVMNLGPAPAEMNLSPAPPPPLDPNQAVVPTSFVVPNSNAQFNAENEPAAPADAAPAGKRSLSAILFKSLNRGNGR